MHEFAEEYVANLKPRDERYDTRLGDDFYVATFPNGVKTWAYVFEVNGYTRRQTLGIYPEMPLPQALEALYGARRTRAVEAELAEQGLDGTQVRKTEDSPVNLTAKMRVPQIKMPAINRRFLAGVITGAVVSFMASLAVWVFVLPAFVTNLPVQTADADVPAAVNTSVTAPLDPVSLAETDTSKPAFESETETPAQEDQALAADVAAEPTVESADEKPAALSKSQQALRQLQNELAGTLAWAQLTSEVRDGEPIDSLSWVVELDNAPRRVFYFVRVRGMAGGTVTYRWRHEGRLLKEDAVRVGEGWHSPAYSGITLTPERLGRWQVEVFGPAGQALGSEEFEARMAKDSPRLSQR